MCFTFRLDIDDTFGDRYELGESMPVTAENTFRPGQEISTILRVHNKPVLIPMTWGIQPPWVHGKYDFFKTANARIETVLTKPSFSEHIKMRRCIIPVRSFVEWKHVGRKKIPYTISVESLVYYSFAGFFAQHDNDENAHYSCSFLTTASDERINDIHDRIPVILSRSLENEWLREDVQLQQFLMKISTNSDFTYVKVPQITDTKPTLFET
jgi:putative SOS response-associated peptidase YedK